MNRLKDKVAIITGAAGGIGRATAELFLEEGADLVLTDFRNIKVLQEFIRKINIQNARVSVIKADLSDNREIKNLVKTALRKFPRIDILVNNAGLFEQVGFEEIKESHFERVMDVNLKAAFFLTQEVIPYFKKQKYGKLINVSSGAGKIGSASAPHYAAAKAGIIALTKSLARLYAGFNINVNAVAPSLIDTDMVRLIPPERLNNLIEAVPLKRLGSPQEVASLILFLASNASDYINGQTISIDGGITMI